MSILYNPIFQHLFPIPKVSSNQKRQCLQMQHRSPATSVLRSVLADRQGLEQNLRREGNPLKPLASEETCSDPDDVSKCN